VHYFDKINFKKSQTNRSAKRLFKGKQTREALAITPTTTTTKTKKKAFMAHDLHSFRDLFFKP